MLTADTSEVLNFQSQPSGAASSMVLVAGISFDEVRLQNAASSSLSVTNVQQTLAQPIDDITLLRSQIIQ